MKITEENGALFIETKTGGYRNRVVITETTDGVLVIKQTGRNVISSVDGFKKACQLAKTKIYSTCKSLSCHYKNNMEDE